MSNSSRKGQPILMSQCTSVYYTRKTHHKIKKQKLQAITSKQKNSKKGKLQFKNRQRVDHKIKRNNLQKQKNVVKNKLKQISKEKLKKVSKIQQVQDKKLLSSQQKQSQLSGSTKLIQIIQKKKNRSLLKLMKVKICVICNELKENQIFKRIFCSKCDDAYHRDCLKTPLSLADVKKLQQWFCQSCQKIEQLSQNDEKKNQKYQKLISKELKLKQNLEIKKFCEQMDNIIFKQMGNFRLFGLNKSSQTIRQKQCLNLKTFTPYKNKQKYWIPLINALSSVNHLYCSQQVYSSQQILQKNKSKYYEPQICEMFHKQDEQQFQQFVQLIQDGQAPPLTVQKCPIKGYLIKSLDIIQPKTIICQYVGQVMTFRQTLKYHNNDSIYRLLETGDSQTTLDIIPIKYGNISKYFLGINNSDVKNYGRINVQSQLFSYKGRNRIIFYTTKKINKGQNLYIDYNAGNINEYPTDDFV